jgi:hypothetical protein
MKPAACIDSINGALTILAYQFPNCDNTERNGVVNFSSNTLQGIGYLTTLYKNCFLLAIQSKIKNESFKWILSPENNKKYFRLVISSNGSWASWNDEEYIINVYPRLNESILVLALTPEMLLRYLTKKQYNQLKETISFDKRIKIAIKNETKVFWNKLTNNYTNVGEESQIIFMHVFYKLLQILTK